MADWYCSSAAYAALPTFQANHAYSTSDVFRAATGTATTANNKHVFVCSTAGTSGSTEPAWNLNNNATTVSGGATFACVTGQAWGLAAGDVGTLTNDGSGGVRAVNGDRLFLSSDHSEASTGKTYFSNLSGTWSGAHFEVISVNRAGSFPPAPADLATGALLAVNGGNLIVDMIVPILLQGLAIQMASANHIYFNNGRSGPAYLKNCALAFNITSGSGRITSNNPVKMLWDHTTVQFGISTQAIGSAGYPFELTWINTPAALVGATMPAALFVGANYVSNLITCRGVDLSALTTALVAASLGGTKLLMESCKIAPGVTRISGTITAPNDMVELVNCFDGTNIINERYVPAGALTTERTITLSGGAQDDAGLYSHKMVSGTLVDRRVLPLDSFMLDVGNAAVGVSKTATVEIVSSSTLNNDDVFLILEYQGTSGSPVASFGWSFPATILTTNAAVTASSATWNVLPATPVTQKLQVTFTPLVAGRVRGRLGLGKASTTLYYNPIITIT